MHGDHLTKIGRGLVVTAEKNNVVYAIEHQSKPIIGVQFHMENKGVSENLTKQIMNKFFGLI